MEQLSYVGYDSSTLSKTSEKNELKLEIQRKKLDSEFQLLILQIQDGSKVFPKHEKIRIEQWLLKLQQITDNLIWKKNRNYYALNLLQMIKNNTIQEPFNKIPTEGPLPKLTKYDLQRVCKPKQNCDEKESINISNNQDYTNNTSSSNLGHQSLNSRSKSQSRLLNNTDNNVENQYRSINPQQNRTKNEELIQENDTKNQNEEKSMKPSKVNKDTDFLPTFEECGIKNKISQNNTKLRSISQFSLNSIEQQKPLKKVEVYKYLKTEIVEEGIEKQQDKIDQSPVQKSQIRKDKENVQQQQDVTNIKNLLIKVRTFFIKNEINLSYQAEYQSLLQQIENIMFSNQFYLDLEKTSSNLQRKSLQPVDDKKFKSISNEFQNKIKRTNETTKQFLQYLSDIKNNNNNNCQVNYTTHSKYRNTTAKENRQ